MEYDVATLSQRSTVSIDTIRYYQSRGLLHAPCRRGRRAVYDESHLDRLERIRAMAERGFSLKAIEAVLAGEQPGDPDRALRAAVEQESSRRRYSGEELAERLGIPRGVLSSVEKAGLAESELDEEGRGSYSDADMRVAEAAVALLRRGFPITKLLGLGVRHDRAVRKTVDEAIDLFDEHVRKGTDGGDEPDSEAVAEAFKELLPVVTTVVAHHFQRVLINRALKRLRRSGQKRALRKALRAASDAVRPSGWT